MTTEASTDSTGQDGDVITATMTTTTKTIQPQQQNNHVNTQSTNHNELSQHPRAKTFTLEKVNNLEKNTINNIYKIKCKIFSNLKRNLKCHSFLLLQLDFHISYDDVI